MSNEVKVKLFAGLIFSKEEIYLKSKSILEKHFGNTDFCSLTLPFYHTKYYEKEFGLNLKRKFISFTKLIPQGRLTRIKIITNKIEKKMISNGNRQINIDPGILSLSKVILATHKDYNHRIYLTKGIYAEVTLFYRNKNFTPWEWTYPDYKTEEYIQIFNHIRTLYSQQI